MTGVFKPQKKDGEKFGLVEYAPLWCKTNYSFLEGASHPDELVAQAAAYGVPALAVTDRDGVYGIVKAHLAAKEHSLKLLVGAQVTVGEAVTTPLLLLAMNRTGYANLSQLLTTGRRRHEKGACSVTWEEVCRRAEGLIALWGGPDSLLVTGATEEVRTLGEMLKTAFGDRLYALVARHQRENERAGELRVLQRSTELGIPPVAGMEVLYHVPERRPLQDILTCIDHGVRLHEASHVLRPNDCHALLSCEEFETRYIDLPEARERTLEVAERCTFSLDEISYRYPEERFSQGETTLQTLRRLTMKGAHHFFGTPVPKHLEERIEKELSLIEQLGYAGYFATMRRIVDYCRENDILCQGRGSAANSVVCFCLGITAVNPEEVDLLFERFISVERNEPPDIDLDIEHHRREEVIQWVYDFYGRDYAALVAVVIRFRTRSALREVGKVLGVQDTSLDQIAKLHHHYESLDTKLLEHAGLDPKAVSTRHLLAFVREIQDFPRHLSTHPGGFLLGAEPVGNLVPIENAAMENRTVLQWEKDDVEALGLFKVDLLGLGGLSVLKACFALMEQHYERRLSMATLPRKCQKTFDMLCRGEAIGVFQVESRAQMSMLPRLKPREYYDLVVQVAIIRPGPIVGGMVHPYIRRRNGEEPLTYPHPCLEPVLKKTFGVPLFQEQAMRIAVEAAGYTPGEADILRKDMAAWRRKGILERHHKRLLEGMGKKGISEEFAERVFEQIKGFGSYGFPESHAASFALITYAVAWFRANAPDVFTAAVLYAQPMGFYSIATLVEDAKRYGTEVRPVDVLQSAYQPTLEPATDKGFAVRMGLRFVKGLREEEAEVLVARRAERPYTSLEDFIDRSAISYQGAQALAAAGALDGLCANRRQAIWEVLGQVKDREQAFHYGRYEDLPLFRALAPHEKITWDYRYSAHSTQGHPLEAFRETLTAQGLLRASEVADLPHGSEARYAGVVIIRQRPGTAKGVVFLTMEDETGMVNVILWKDVFEQYKLTVKSNKVLAIAGEIQVGDGEVTHLIAREIWAPLPSQQLHTSKSRDFH